MNFSQNLAVMERGFAVNVSELVVRSSATDAAVAFVKWARGHGVQTNGCVKIGLSRGMRSLITTKEIPPRHPMIIVPNKATLGLHTVLKDNTFPHTLTPENYDVDIGMQKLRPHHAVLASYMVWKWMRKDEDWFPYMAFLPRTEANFEFFHEVMTAISTDPFADILDGYAARLKMDTERFNYCARWALTMLMSRGVYFSDARRVAELYKGTMLEGHLETAPVLPVMCPMMDLVNHAPHPSLANAAQTSPATGNSLNEFITKYNLADADTAGGGYFALCSLDRSIPAGTEVMSHYASSTDREFEFMYGFPAREGVQSFAAAARGVMQL
eukprot:PhM_4_TR5568/c0_g1_i1/m.56847